MYTSVHSDVSQESGCTTKGQAAFIKASQVLVWMRTLCCLIAVYTEIDCGHKSLLT